MITQTPPIRRSMLTNEEAQEALQTEEKARKTAESKLNEAAARRAELEAKLAW